MAPIAGSGLMPGVEGDEEGLPFLAHSEEDGMRCARGGKNCIKWQSSVYHD